MSNSAQRWVSLPGRQIDALSWYLDQINKTAANPKQDMTTSGWDSTNYISPETFKLICVISWIIKSIFRAKEMQFSY